MIGKLFANWRFRSSTPVFVPGEKIRAYLTSFSEATGEGTARVGDTVLQVSGAGPEQVDQLLELHIESFDAAQSTGRATVGHAGGRARR